MNNPFRYSNNGELYFSALKNIFWTFALRTGNELSVLAV